MNKIIFPLVIIGLILAAIVLLPACTLDHNGLRSPEAEARATAISQAAIDESAARAIERQALQAEADKAKTEAQAAQEAKDSLVWRNRLIAWGTGAGAVVLFIGLSLAFVGLVNKKVNTVHADANGMYPIVITRGFGWAALHDPNRGLGPSSLYRTPTLLDQLAAVVIAIKTRQSPQLPSPKADFPATADTGAMLQVASQAQAIGLMSAVTRPQGLLGGQSQDLEQTRKLSEMVINSGANIGGRMPTIRLIDDKEQAQKLLTMFESDGEE